MNNRIAPLLIILMLFINFSCKQQNARTHKISLAEWSLHRSIFSQEINHLDFARIAKDSFNLSHIEYVSQFFQAKAEDKSYLKQMKDSCEKYKVQSLMIMIDGEGNLGDTSNTVRKKAVENHYKWIDAANFLSCQSVRVNGNGIGLEQEVADALIQSLTQLSAYAEKRNINVLVENHGMQMPDNTWNAGTYATNGKWLANVLKAVNKPNCGALPDFGNFHNYNAYQGVKDLMPYAKGISAKTYNFDKNGKETTLDFEKMFKIIFENNFNGFIGIEYEGKPENGLSEYEGVRKTIALIEKYYP